jgi:aspartate-semialdehyde dehydrogenase
VVKTTRGKDRYTGATNIYLILDDASKKSLRAFSAAYQKRTAVFSVDGIAIRSAVIYGLVDYVQISIRDDAQLRALTKRLGNQATKEQPVIKMDEETKIQ